MNFYIFTGLTKVEKTHSSSHFKDFHQHKFLVTRGHSLHRHLLGPLLKIFYVDFSFKAILGALGMITD